VKLLLTAISGSREGKSFTIEPNQSITFGRTSASTWSFEDDGHMSSIHFEVENLGSHGEVRDRGSTNGTWLNNVKINRESLREGDRIRAGKTVLTVEFVQPIPAGEGIDAAQPVAGQQPPSLSRTPVDFPESPRTDPHSPLGPSAESPVVIPTPSTPPAYAYPEPPMDGPRRSPPDPSEVAFNAPPPPSRPINPFDSIDFSEPAAPPPVDAELPVNFRQPYAAMPEHRVDNPISDSSFSFQVPAFPTSVNQAASPPTANGTHLILERRTTLDAADAFAIIAGALSQRWSIQLVLHFQKIRSTPTPECKVQPLFSWLPSELARDFSPVRLSWSDAQASPTLLALLPRLCRADACLAFLGKSTVETAAQVEKMLSVGVDRFSEPGGFLPACWPSSFATLIDVSGPRIAKNLFAQHISGAILCSPWDRNKLVAVVDDSLDADLRDNSFVDVSRISG
jgi:predicted component of type VI protein secretion system